MRFRKLPRAVAGHQPIMPAPEQQNAMTARRRLPRASSRQASLTAFRTPRINNILHSCRSLLRRLMLPDPDRHPACIRESPVGVRISGSIGSHFLSPITRISHRNGVVLGAAVPETTIEENRHTLRWKHQVSGPSEALYRLCGYPVPEAACMDGGSQCHFRSCVATAVGTHAGPHPFRRCPRLGHDPMLFRHAGGNIEICRWPSLAW